MKLNRLMLVTFILLAVISFGAVSAASDDATADDAVASTADDLEINPSDVSEINIDGDDSVAVDDDVNKDSKLGVSAEEDELSAGGSVAPNYTIDVSPNEEMQGSNYIAQYGQTIVVNGTFENATGNVSIRFGYSGNYFDYKVELKNGKFSQNLTDYNRIRNNYQIQVSYSGDDYYKSVSWSRNIHVQMANVTANDAYYGLTPYMDVNLFEATGNVTFVLNDEQNYTAELVDGKVIYEFTNYTVGKNYVDMYYSGDDKFNPIERSFSFNVDVNVEAPTIYNYQKAIVSVYFGNATGKTTIALGNESYTLDIVKGVATTEFKNYTVGTNTLNISYTGDKTFNPFTTTYDFKVLDKENATVISSVYKTASQNFIFISIPHAGNATINVTVNGKKEVWELVNDTVKKDINASENINELTVVFDGNVRLNPANTSFYVNLTDYIVNNKTFRNYFDLDNGGRLYDFIEDGITLDFQGSIINPVSANEMNIEISKPINVISSTGDAYIDLNTTAGSLLGEHPGSSFVVGRDGSGSNISGIYLHNTELWISNTTNVVFDNISVVVEDQRVGSGVGATSVRDNSSYVTLKNSYFYTRNNGGSTTFTFAWADHCIFDNNTVKAEGNVGNLLYLNVYNIKNAPSGVPLNTYNQFINNRVYGKEGSAISVGIMVEGAYNIIANNTLYKCSASTSFGGVGAHDNIYYGNTMTEGSGLTAQANSIVYDNNVTGALSTGANSIAYGNTVGKALTVGANAVAYNNEAASLTISGANGVAYGNTISGDAKLNGATNTAYSNSIGGTLTMSKADGNAYQNVIKGNVVVSGANAQLTDNVIAGTSSITGKDANVTGNAFNSEVTIGKTTNVAFENNVVRTSNDYAVIVDDAATGITVVDNELYAKDLYGDEAVENTNEANIVENNTPIKPTLIVSADDILAGEALYVNVSIANAEFPETTVHVIVNGKKYTAEKVGDDYAVFIDDLAACEYVITAVSEASGKYGEGFNQTTATVSKATPTLNIDTTEAIIGKDVNVTASLEGVGVVGGNITFIVDGVENTVALNDSVAVYTIEKIDSGKHAIIAIFKGDDENEAAFNFTAFNLQKAIPTVDVVVPTNVSVGDNATISVSVPGATGGVVIIIDGVEHTVALDNGAATYDLTNITAGNHSVVVVYAGDEKTDSAYASKAFSVEAIPFVRVDTKITVDPQITRVACDRKIGEPGALFYAYLTDVDGNPLANKTVQITTIGKIYNVTTDEKGGAGLMICSAIANSYTYALAFKGDDTCNGAPLAASVLTITKKATAISASNQVFKATAKTKVITVTLKTVKNKYDGKTYLKKGKKITLTINGKTYKAFTNAKGVAKFTVKLTKKATYKAVVKFNGDYTYKASSKKITVRIK